MVHSYSYSLQVENFEQKRLFINLLLYFRLEKQKSAKRKAELRILYRAHQIFHNFNLQLIRIIAPVTVSTAEIINIIAIYTTIRLSRYLGPFLLFNFIVIDVVCLLVVQIAMDFAYRMTEYSTVFSKSLTIDEFAGYVPSAEERSFVKSCRPLHWKLGDYFTVTKNTFPTILDKIIIQTVVYLLIFT